MPIEKVNRPNPHDTKVPHADSDAHRRERVDMKTYV